MGNGLSVERRQIILDSLRLVERVSAGVGVTSYLWGGMACDVYAGHLLRDHHDLDYLTVDLHARIDEFGERFHQAGCETRILINGDLKVEGTGINMHFGHIELDKQVRWVHDRNRADGVLCFPVAWMSPKPYILEGLPVHVVEPELEYVIKCQPNLLNPKWKARSQDLDALERTKNVLSRRNVEVNRLHTQVETL